MRVTKNWKLYTEHEVSKQARNLAKMSPQLYLFIINYMIGEGTNGNKRYAKQNEHLSIPRGIEIVVPEELNILVKELKARGYRREITYGGNKMHLVTLLEAKV